MRLALLLHRRRRSHHPFAIRLARRRRHRFALAVVSRSPYARPPLQVIGREVEKASQGIYPLQNVYVRKVKILKAPKFDINKLLELHSGEVAEDSGAKVPKGDYVEPAVLTSVSSFSSPAFGVRFR